jgi:uncharacterized protein YeaO (DUF488 family)
MVIKTKSVFQPAEEEDGLRILITRFYPRGVKKGHFDLWLRELSPSADLLMSYKDDRVKWEEFVAILKNELYSNMDSWETINVLNKDSKNGDITLLCYERSHAHCHRHIVRDIIEEPKRLADFVSEYADDHEGCQMPSLISHK